MPDPKSFTIIRLQDAPTSPGSRRPDHVTIFPAVATTAAGALDAVLTELAVTESHALAGLPRSDPDWDMELMNAMDTLEGRFEVYAGNHVTRPLKERPVLAG